MKYGRSMQGGRRYKMIRENPKLNEDSPYRGGPCVAIEKGEDLIVSPKVFDALEDAVSHGRIIERGRK